MLASALIGLVVQLLLLWRLVRTVSAIEEAKTARSASLRERYYLIGPTLEYEVLLSELQDFVRARTVVRMMGGSPIVLDDALAREARSFNQWASVETRPQLLLPLPTARPPPRKACLMNGLVERAAADAPFATLAATLRERAVRTTADAVLSKVARNLLLELYPNAVAEPSQFLTPTAVIQHRIAISVHCLGWEYLALLGFGDLKGRDVIPYFRELHTPSSAARKAFILLTYNGAPAVVAARLVLADGFLRGFEP